VGAAADQRGRVGDAQADRVGRGRGWAEHRDRRPVGVARTTVRTWRNRFAEQRLDGLLDEPRPGRPRTVSDAQVETLITATLETRPKDATHWSTRSMAAHLGMSQSTVSRVWRAFGPAPRSCR
jgi:transposase